MDRFASFQPLSSCSAARLCFLASRRIRNAGPWLGLRHGGEDLRKPLARRLGLCRICTRRILVAAAVAVFSTVEEPLRLAAAGDFQQPPIIPQDAAVVQEAVDPLPVKRAQRPTRFRAAYRTTIESSWQFILSERASSLAVGRHAGAHPKSCHLPTASKACSKCSMVGSRRSSAQVTATTSKRAGYSNRLWRFR